MSDVLSVLLGIATGIGGLIVIYLALSWIFGLRKNEPAVHVEDTSLRTSDAWVITPEDVRKATPSLTAAAQPDRAPYYVPHPKYRIRYQPHLGSWAVYKWHPKHTYYYGYGIRYPIEGRWVLQTRVPKWEDAINLITPNPASERGSSHKEEQ